jgi:hypothetical protein
MAQYVPPDWPAGVHSPGSERWEGTAVTFPVKFFCSTDLAVATLLGRLLCHSRLILFPRAIVRI